MRFIPINDIRLPDSWQKKAQKAFEAMNRCETAEQRQKVLIKYGDVWRDSDLKAELERLSDGKCWYCESREDRSDNPVDHFRPKGRVAECEDHEGYWWLAFDWKNYRLSCTWCNSLRTDHSSGMTGGKADHFPLIAEDDRVKIAGKDLSREHPCLLDPTRREDTELLWFRQDGVPISKYSKNENEEAFIRVQASIKLYHLDASKANERRMDLYNTIERHVKHGDRMLENLEVDVKDQSALVGFGFVVDEIRRKITPDAEFSAAARAYLFGLRESGREWLDILLFENEIAESEDE